MENKHEGKKNEHVPHYQGAYSGKRQNTYLMSTKITSLELYPVREDVCCCENTECCGEWCFSAEIQSGKKLAA